MKEFIIRELTIILTAISYANNLSFFSNPQLLSSEEIAKEIDSQSLDMAFQINKNNFFHFTTKKNEVYFEILLDNIPYSFKSIENLFIEKLDNDIKYHIFTYENKNGLSSINKPHDETRELSPNDSSYLIQERRICENSKPQSINENQLLSIIKTKNILFYTGAGLSATCNVPTMNKLLDLLELKEGEAMIYSLKSAIESPEKFAKKILEFHNACFLNPPSEAHKALKKLAIYKNTKIVTENLDCLHESSGIIPYRINANEIREKAKSELKDIDYIICIGLSHDDRGFLGYYKNINPNGIIIAINLNIPSYLGNEDLIINEDLQKLVPRTTDKILKK